VPDILPRRRLLLASATTIPLLLATAGCRSSDLFAGPDPLGGRPPLSHDVVTLQAVIAAEENLVDLYRSAVNGDSRTISRRRDLEPLLAQHEQHLSWLRARLVVPAGQGGSGGRGAPPRRGGLPGGSSPPGMAELRQAESASAASLVQRLATVQPALAQLFASIAASDATHVAVLAGLGH
jgi:hypothetical protein